MKNIDLEKSKNWLVNKIFQAEFRQLIPRYIRGRLLDIGCGEKPYKKMIAPHISEHIGVDHVDTQHNKSEVDLIGTAYQIPADDECFDTVLCTAVLEHLEEPCAAIKEANRVLKINGHAVYSVPLFWHLHEEPRDFYRFTRYGLKYLFEKNGFEIAEMLPLSGFWVTFGQEFVYYLWRFRRGGQKNPLWWIVPPIGIITQLACYILSKLDKSHEFTWLYLVVAKKYEKSS